jgi:bifunctional oligoribonuclease and PAP phosphatase NrnA
MSPLEAEAARLKQLLEHARRVLITAPAPADGDSIGSQLAIRAIVRAHFPKLDVCIVNEDVLLERYRHLPGANDVELPSRYGRGDFDVGIVVDGGADRLGEASALYEGCKHKIQIDHHAVGASYKYDLRVWDPKAAATTEVVYRITISKALHTPLTAEFAQALYVGVIFDTGYFRHGNTTPETLEFCAALLRTGFNFSDVGERAMLMRTMGGIQLMGRVMAEAKVSAAGRVLSGVVPRHLLRSFAARDEDRDGIIDQLTLVEGIEVAVLFHETEGGDVKISFRSKTDFDVAALARQLSPTGGGHRKASGCTLEGPLDVTVGFVLASIDKMLT